jgi:hypothetical protein
MSRPTPPLPPETRALLDQERAIPPVPAVVRARVLARARASLAAAVLVGRSAPAAAPRTRWAAAAALICVVGVGVGAAAYQIRAHLQQPPKPAPVAPPVEKVAPPPPPAVIVPAAPERAVETHRLSPRDAARAELRLLQQARAAVARADYAAALTPIGEHARRFRDGRLVEEREALRVKSLAGLGRTEDAHRAAVAFRARFPRSVLLPAVSQMPASRP